MGRRVQRKSLQTSGHGTPPPAGPSHGDVDLVSEDEHGIDRQEGRDRQISEVVRSTSSTAASEPRMGERRLARRHSPRWWAERLDYPLSTIYKAIQRGHLKALRPRGGSYVIPPRDFADWFEGGQPQSGRPLDRPPAMPDQDPVASRFRHVRWSQLPDGTPDGAGDS